MDVGQTMLHGLERTDGNAELVPIGGMSHRQAQHRLRHTNGLVRQSETSGGDRTGPGGLVHRRGAGGIDLPPHAGPSGLGIDTGDGGHRQVGEPGPTQDDSFALDRHNDEGHGGHVGREHHVDFCRRGDQPTGDEGERFCRRIQTEHTAHLELDQARAPAVAPLRLRHGADRELRLLPHQFVPPELDQAGQRHPLPSGA